IVFRAGNAGTRLPPPVPAGPPAPAEPTPPPPRTPSPFSPGARSAGDRLFPTIGNGGYDVQHYGLEFQFEPLTDIILGEATITAQATQGLSEFSLDLVTMDVSTVKVGGRESLFTQENGKLIVMPATGIPRGETFTTTITYGGLATPYEDPDGSHEGFMPTEDGAFVVNEPVGAMTWFPNNNVPTDKALYDITVTVPEGMTVFGNGRLVSNESSGAHRAWHWREDRPMATYLTTATNGTFQRTTDTSDPAIPYEYGVDPKLGPAAVVAQQGLEISPGVSEFFEETLDVPYPFTSSGGVVDIPPPAMGDAPYALESQTRPMYPALASATTVAHEIAHQWFGNSVSPAQWADIWLNEGPAEFYSWLWDERANDSGTTTEEQFDSFYADEDFDWSVPPANPPPDEIFNVDAMYNRGAMVMEALRQIAGEPTFLDLNRKWLNDHAYSHATTADFIELFRTHAGVNRTQLAIFFDEWLYRSGKPGITPDNFATYTP
ncbi:MAG TPA: M1 family metallopeptidase, partial [Solirubrobacteraceae bacterium]|nr:M1 family metallopeptidase [Solirubrobacteraceae bacterium]